MLTVYFCEDNKKQLDTYVSIAENHLLIEEVDMKLELATTDPHELLSHKQSDDSSSLYFFDVELETDINGFQLAQKVRELDPRAFMVFITTQSHLATMTFQYKLEVMDYIIKDDIANVGNRIRDCLVMAYKRYGSSKGQLRKVYAFKVGDRIRNIEMDTIVAIETASTAHKLRITTDSESMDFYGKLKEEYEKLDESFILGHRSIILNVDHVDHVDLKKKIAIMDNGQVFMLSASGLKLLKQVMNL